MNLVLDTRANRKAIKYSGRFQAKRIIWIFLLPLFRFSPRPFFKWRSFLLKLLGARLGKDVRIYGSSFIYFPWNLEVGDFSSIGERAIIYNLGKITIGRHVTISQYAHLCAGSHEYSSKRMELLKPEIRIEDSAWICADAFISGGVTVKEGAIAGARAVVTKDVEPWAIVCGNPAKFIKTRLIQDQHE